MKFSTMLYHHLLITTSKEFCFSYLISIWDSLNRGIAMALKV